MSPQLIIFPHLRTESQYFNKTKWRKLYREIMGLSIANAD